jgi:hypothetical protein
VVIDGDGMADTVSPTPDAHFIVERTGRHGASAGKPASALGALGVVSSYERILRISLIAVVTLVLVFWDRRPGK